MTSPSGLDRAERALSEARDRERGGLLRDTLRDLLWRDLADTERFLPAAGEDAGASASDLSSPPSSLADIASTSALLLLVRYAGRGRGGWVAGSCRGASSPDCSPDSSSLVANSLGLLAALPRGLDAAPKTGVNAYKVENLWSRPLVLDMILERRLSYAR